MTYFGFLLQFIVVPIIVLGLLLWRQSRQLPAPLRGWSGGKMLAALVLIALAYTTPWDNYLVATGVWWYDPALVTGITLGWVPIEEYTFFVLQPILVGLWLLLLARRLPIPAPISSMKIRVVSVAVVGIIWLSSLAILISGWIPGTYLGLQLIWALPPILLQLVFGADILWRHRRLVLLTLLPMVLYLSATDLLAIHSGTWTIDPEQSLNVMIAGILPLEEALFFFLTSTLVTFGLTLGIAVESRERARRLLSWIQQNAAPFRGSRSAKLDV